MAKLQLITGAYQARSIIAECQRCVNLYMEVNPKDAPFGSTHYPTPGIRTLGSVPTNGWRQLFVASNGALYGVAGQTVYLINPNYTFQALGTINSIAGFVSMVDNGTILVIVDGTPTGYQIVLATNTLSTITDPAFLGGNRIDFVDGYFVTNSTQNNLQWYISLFQQAAWDPLDFASKNGYSDPLIATIVTKRNVWLFGSQTTEVWANTGAADFTFQRIDGIFIQHGLGAIGSLSQMDGSIYWLCLDPQGHAMIMRTHGYDALRISTHAQEVAFQSYSTVSDAISYTYQQDGHLFYVINFPAADKTWVYDLSTEQWHERASIDADGNLHRHRSNCCVFYNDQHIVGDFANGNFYALDPNQYTDNGTAIPRIRSFPHLVDDGNRVMYRQFIADMEVGNGMGNNARVPLFLRWSDTRGASWSNAIKEDLGSEGEYLRSVQFQRLGMARDRVFEVSWSSNVKTALNGAFLETMPARQ